MKSCQDVSAAGKRAGIKDGTRSGLWSVFADAIDQLRPPLVVIENVRGLLSAQAHRNVEPDEGTVGDRSDRPVLRAIGAVLGDLADLGYDAQWATVAAADIGAPHRRERVFVLATHADPDEGGWGGRREASWGDLGRHNEVDGRRGSIPTKGRNRFTSDPQGDGWDEGRPESARQQRGFDAALRGNGHVDLLPTPRASDPCGAESRSSEGFRPQLGEVVRELCQPDKVISTEYHGAMSILTTDSGKDQTVVVTSDGDGVAVDVCSGVKSHDTVVAPELAGTKLDLLPTPTTRDGKGRNQRDDTSCLHGALLPTPSAADGSRGQDYARANREGSGGDDLITAAVKAHNANQWGKYAAAIRRWEQIAGSAPDPTEPNRNGKPRLNPAFSEWMMGWPSGWVTDPDIGISRNDQLKCIGNGVCPQQAIAALRYLLTVSEVAA